MRKLFFIFLLFPLLLSAQSTYYVATTGGDAGHTGAIDDPWLTITYAESQISGGDTIYIRGGTYVERIIVSGVDGTAEARTYISGYQAEEVIIDGEYTLPGGTGSYWYSFFFIIDDDYVTLNSVTLTRSTGGLLTINGDYSYGYNIVGDGAYETGIILTGDYCIFDNCSMTDNGNHYGIGGQTTWGSAICCIGQHDIIRNCTSYENRGEGFNAYGPTTLIDATIEDCIAYDNKALNLYLSLNTIAQRNLCYYTAGYSATSARNITVAAEQAEGNANLVIINNICYNGFVNLETDSNVTGLYGVTIAHNTFVNARGNQSLGYTMGVYFRPNLTAFSNSIFKDNIVIEDDNAWSVPIYVAASHDGLTFDYNLWNEAPMAGAVGANDIVSVAHFTDSLTHDYTLKATSPAIDAGTNVGVNTDYLAALRDASPDIGAYEYDPPVAPPAVLPSVITGSIKVWSRGATASGNVTDDGDGTISARGICWATSANPDLTDNVVTVSGTTGIFTAKISGLTKNTTYHMRSYATNETGTAYGSDIGFTTSLFSYILNGKPIFNGKILVY